MLLIIEMANGTLDHMLVVEGGFMSVNIFGNSYQPTRVPISSRLNSWSTDVKNERKINSDICAIKTEWMPTMLPM